MKKSSITSSLSEMIAKLEKKKNYMTITGTNINPPYTVEATTKQTMNQEYQKNYGGGGGYLPNLRPRSHWCLKKQTKGNVYTNIKLRTQY